MEMKGQKGFGLLEILITLLEFLLELLLRLLGRRSFLHDSIGIDKADLHLGNSRLRKRGQHQGCQRGLNNSFHSNLHQHHCRSDQKTVPNWNWNFWVLSPSSFLSA